LLSKVIDLLLKVTDPAAVDPWENSASQKEKEDNKSEKKQHCKKTPKDES